MTDPAFKTATFIKKRNALRDAVRREGTQAIQAAWDAFEGYTDCLTADDAKEAHQQGYEAGLRRAGQHAASVTGDAEAYHSILALIPDSTPPKGDTPC